MRIGWAGESSLGSESGKWFTDGPDHKTMPKGQHCGQGYNIKIGELHMHGANVSAMVLQKL